MLTLTPGRRVLRQSRRSRPSKRLRLAQGRKRSSGNSVLRDQSRIIKQFAGAEQFTRELACYRAVQELGIAPRIRRIDRRSLTIEMDPCGIPARRLPRSALPSDFAKRSFAILAALHEAGFAHRDFHSGNLLVDSDFNVRLVDFEWAYNYGPDVPPLELTYDLTGEGLESPSRTNRMHWDHRHRASLRSVTGVSAAQAYSRYLSELHTQLAAASGYKLGLPFRRRGLLYQTFHHPRFQIEKGQRNVQQRFEAMKLGELGGQTVLDLGANLGSTSIQACLQGAAGVVAVEADPARVRVARKVAAVTGLHRRIEFLSREVQEYLASNRAQADVVLCLALDAWVDDPEWLYRQIASATRRLLIFESNRIRQPAHVESRFRGLGFCAIEFLGTTEREDAFGSRRLLFRMEKQP